MPAEVYALHVRYDLMRLAALRVSVGFTVALSLAACGGGSSGLPPASTVAYDTSAPVSAPSGAPVDDWTTFAHDMLRSGYQPQSTGISTSTVGSLTLRWSYSMGVPVKASPLVAGGVVYVAARNGTVRALDARTGSPLWQASVGGPVNMTPTLAACLI
jgi:glucose dehydrogenase